MPYIKIDPVTGKEVMDVTVKDSSRLYIADALPLMRDALKAAVNYSIDVSIAYGSNIANIAKKKDGNAIYLLVDSIEMVGDISQELNCVAHIELHCIFRSGTDSSIAFAKGFPIAEQLLYYLGSTDCALANILKPYASDIPGQLVLLVEKFPDDDSTVDFVIPFDIRYCIMFSGAGEALKTLVKHLYAGETLIEETVIGDPLPVDDEEP